MTMTTEILNNIPVHVSMIMDGNGRWAKERGKERVYGHFEGVESVRACVEAAVETGVKYLSLYAFSEENWNRPQAEVDTLMELMVKAMAAEMPSLDSNGVRFMVIGNRARLAPALNEVIDSCMAQTASNDTLTLIIFLSYSGKWDILQAAKKMVAEAIEMLRGIKHYYEEFHKIQIPESILNRAVVLSERYITDRYLPDKAIDLLDEAASKLSLSSAELNESLEIHDKLLALKSDREALESNITSDDKENQKRCPHVEKIVEMLHERGIQTVHGTHK